MLHWKSIFLFSIVLSGFVSGVAQTELQRREPAPAAYSLGAGDQIVLHVTDMEEVSDKPLRIDPSGFIDLPLAGRVQAGGLTIDQLKAELTTRLSKYITSPQVSINLLENQSRPVSVMGAVNAPGVQQLAGARHLIEVISLSGGIRSDAGPAVIVSRDARYGTLASPGAHVSTVDGHSTATYSLDDLLAQKNPEDNILVQPGDVVTIPKADLIYVVGDVKRAGGFPLTTHASTSVLQAVSLSEGLGPHASSKHARILRKAPGGDGKPKEIPVDIQSILAGQSPDIPLYANDVLFVPNSTSKAAAERAIEVALGLTTGILVYRR